MAVHLSKVNADSGAVSHLISNNWPNSVCKVVSMTKSTKREYSGRSPKCLRSALKSSISTKNASLIAALPRPSTLYQHGWPRLVTEESIISSAINNQAWSISMTQPRTANRHRSSFVARPPKSKMPDSTTISPRFILPPVTL